MKTIRECTQIIGTIERGDAAHGLTNEIDKTLKALQEAAGEKRSVKGSVTMTLNFSLEGQNMEIEAVITSKLPKVKRPRTFMFLTQNAELSLEHPTQGSLFEGPREVANK